MVVAVDDVFAEENLNLNNEVQKEEKEEIFEQPILLEPEETAPKEEEQSQEEPKFKTMLKGIVEQEYALNDISGLFKSYLTHNYEKGPLKNTTLQMSNIMNWTEKFDKGDSDFTYDSCFYSLNVLESTSTNTIGFYNGIIGEDNYCNTTLYYSSSVYNIARPSIILNANVKLLGGDGTQNNPYVIE